MSIYSDNLDFRDILKSHFNDNFEDFLRSTGGILHFIDPQGYLQSIKIKHSYELIPFYSFEASTLRVTPTIVNITIKDKSIPEKYLDNIAQIEEKYNIEGLNLFKKDIIINPDYELLKLYRKAIFEYNLTESEQIW